MRLSRFRDDSGFSLSELLIVSGLMVLVLSLSYALSFAVTEGNRISEAQGTAARDTGQPLQWAEKYLMQALEIEDASPMRIQYRIDRDLTTAGTGERQVLEVTSEGELLLTTTPIDAAFNPTAAPNTAVLSSYAVNVAEGQPLFRYYDPDEVEVTSMGYVPSKTRSIVVRLVVERNGTQHTDSRSVTLRNRE